MRSYPYLELAFCYALAVLFFFTGQWAALTICLFVVYLVRRVQRAEQQINYLLYHDELNTVRHSLNGVGLPQVKRVKEL